VGAPGARSSRTSISVHGGHTVPTPAARPATGSVDGKWSGPPCNARTSLPEPPRQWASRLCSHLQSRELDTKCQCAVDRGCRWWTWNRFICLCRGTALR